MRGTTPWLIAAGFAALGGCGEAFPRYNELDALRVLAIRAEPPALLPGESTTLSALVFEPIHAEVSHAWSWCPLRGTPEDPFACAVSAEELAAELAQDAPGLDVDYDLGAEPTAQFAHGGAASVVAGLCALKGAPGAPDFVAWLDCSQGFPISIELRVRAGEDEIQALKTVYLALDAAAPANQNPTLGDLHLGKSPASRAEAALLPEAAGGPEVSRGTDYDLFVDVPERSSEGYVPPPSLFEPEPAPRREVLALTWFVEGGETTSMRTSFIPGEVGRDVLEKNGWRTPFRSEHAGAAVRLFLVLRDNRGGVAWMQRTVSILDP